MALTKVCLGDIVLPYVQKCNNPNLTADDISGVNKDKEFFEPSKQAGSDTSNYKVVPPAYFACNLMHVGRDRVLPIALNHTNRNKIVSPAYTVFCLNDQTLLLNEFFLMMLKSNERDRYFWFHTDTSVRDGMAWEDFCEVEVAVPSISVQKKFVTIYYALQEMLKVHLQSVSHLQCTFRAYLDGIKKTVEKVSLQEHIELCSERNGETLGLDSVRGVSIQKKFIYTKADMGNVSLKSYFVVKPNEFCYVPITSRNGDKISLAINDSQENYLVSSTYVVFRVKDTKKLNPKYLLLWLSTSEFDRYARFNSWGSAREAFDWTALESLEIPMPDITIQNGIVGLLEAQREEEKAFEKATDVVSGICPILIAGALKEGAKS